MGTIRGLREGDRGLPGLKAGCCVWAQSIWRQVGAGRCRARPPKHMMEHLDCTHTKGKKNKSTEMFSTFFLLSSI